MAPQRRPPHTLIPGTCDRVTSCGKGTSQVGLSGWALNVTPGALRGGVRRGLVYRRRGGRVTVESDRWEVTRQGVMSPEDGVWSGDTSPPLETAEECSPQAVPTRDMVLDKGLRNCRESLGIFKPLVCSHLLQQPQGTDAGIQPGVRGPRIKPSSLSPWLLNASSHMS